MTQSSKSHAMWSALRINDDDDKLSYIDEFLYVVLLH